MSLEQITEATELSTLDKTKLFILDSTVVASATNAIMAPLEVFAFKMQNQTSLNARIAGTALTFLGLGYLFTKGRKMLKGLFKTSQRISDAIYGIGFSLIYNPLMYYFAGSRNPEEIIKATLAGTALAFPGYLATGYLVDHFRNLTGWNNKNILPLFNPNQADTTKKSLAVASIAAANASCLAIYALNGWF